MNSSKKLIRHGKLQKLIQKDPFLTDEQLAKTLKVSVGAAGTNPDDGKYGQHAPESD